MKHVRLVADGSCLNNPGAGGWACILKYNGCERVLTGSERDTTNNRMELRAVIEGFRALKEPCTVDVLTDSQYVQRGMSDYIERWRSNGWRTAAGGAVANRELWEELYSITRPHTTNWVWVRGHRASDSDQTRCDALAAEAAKNACC